eukprot:gene3066-4814_t
MGGLASVTRICILICGIATLACGIFHIVFKLVDGDEWCNDNIPGIKCIGTILAWSNEKDLALRDLQALGWRRDMFTFQLDTFADLWTPTFMGIATIFGIFAKNMRLGIICRSWLSVTLWLAVMLLWANFGYAGDLGVVAGFFASI